MSAHAESARGGRALVIRGRPYPILLPKLRDPRLHLAAVIVSLQILGQVAFDFKLSIAQILVALFTCAVIEVGIAFRKQHVILWPASALLTGNGVAFILRVPGTVHGDWWSMNGWWIYAGTAAVSLLSKYVIKLRGRHIFNPSNFGLVLCFLILGKGRAFPLEFWWGPMSPWMALALAIIVAGGLAILLRVHLIGIAIGFWVTFAVAIGVISLAGHEMTASLPSRADHGRLLLVGADHLARGPGVHVLHDHRPEDDPERHGRAARLRGRHRAAVRAADVAADDRVRHQGRAARLAHPRLRGPAAARMGRSRRTRPRPGSRAPSRTGGRGWRVSASPAWPSLRRSRGCSSSSGFPRDRAPRRRHSSSAPGSCLR